MAILDKMKVALRVSNNIFDDEIASVIGAARAELARAGVSPDKANDESDDLITAAIRAYVMATYSTDVSPQKSTNISDGYWESFRYQCDCLRKSGYYTGASV